MNTLSTLYSLLSKDIKVEFRQRILTATILLFVASACFTIYQVFFAGKARVNPLVWNSLFWLVVLFSSFQVVGKSFSKELDQQFWYYFFIVRADLLILSKLIYHFIMLNITSWLSWIFLSVFFQNPVQDVGLFSLAIELACLGLSAGLTLVSAISAKAGKNSTLLPVLGFPLIIPTLLFVIKLSVNALDALGWDLAWPHILTLASLDCIMIVLSFILFPYLWRG